MRLKITLSALLIWALAACSQQPLPLTILHWNDFHAQNLPTEVTRDGKKESVGGAAYLATLLDSLRHTLPRALVLHAGDEFTGTPISSITQGKSQIELLNVIKPDAFELGNHEFDVGWENLKQRMQEADFPILCCNVVDSITGKPIAKPSILFEREGIKIAVIGVMTRHLEGSVLPQSLSGNKVEDPIPIVNRLLNELCPQSDVQIAITHQGVDEDVRLAKSCPRLDVIVGGHQHKRLFEPLKQGDVLILQAGAKGEFLGFFQAMVDTAADKLVSYQGKLLPINPAALKPEPRIAAMIAQQEELVGPELNRVIGELTVAWERSDGESNIGNWTADAMAKLTQCDVAFINSGGLRKNLPVGPIRVRDVWELHPFGNQIQGFQLSGAELKRTLEFQIKNLRNSLQMGNLRYRARRDGQINELTIAGKPVDENRNYTVASNEYVVEHADRFFGFDLTGRDITYLGWIDRDLIIEAIEAEKTITSRVDGRIIIEK